MNRFLRRSLGAVVVALAVMSTSCSMTLDATHLGVPASLASGPTPAEGATFKVTSHAVYGFWGLFKISEPSLQKTLASQLVGGKEVADVRVHVRSRFGDLLVTALTLGLVVPRAVTVEGVIIEK